MIQRSALRRPTSAKILGLLASLSLLVGASCGTKSAVIDLPASQSMLITGKGPGQDAAVNPFAESNSQALIKNLGTSPFSVRVQDKAGHYEEFIVLPRESKKIFLLAGKELYLDSSLNSRARVSFEKAGE